MNNSITRHNPIDPNPAISAHVVFPKSGHIRSEKQPFLRKNPHFSKFEYYEKNEPLIGVQYIILKTIKSSIYCKSRLSVNKLTLHYIIMKVTSSFKLKF